MESKLTTQVRAYVEYRMFSVMSRFGPACLGLSIRLEDSNTARMKTQYRCSAILDLLPAARVRIRSSGDRLYGTIDTVAERLAREVERRLIKESIVAGDRTAAGKRETSKERDHRGGAHGPRPGATS
jgi:ribosome-associated translation inhibitor RaiA